MQTKFKIGDLVLICGLDVVGSVTNVRNDGLNRPLVDISVPTGTSPDGLWVAREEELKRVG